MAYVMTDDGIDCTVCVAVNPKETFVGAGGVRQPRMHFIEIDARNAKAWPVIEKIPERLPQAAAWSGVVAKPAQRKNV